MKIAITACKFTWCKGELFVEFEPELRTETVREQQIPGKTVSELTREQVRARAADLVGIEERLVARWTCPRCKVNRLAEPCPRRDMIASHCPMAGTGTAIISNSAAVAGAETGREKCQSKFENKMNFKGDPGAFGRSPLNDLANGPQPEPTVNCECEHVSHFHWDHGSPDSHPYGKAPGERLYTIHTVYGKFRVCEACTYLHQPSR